MRMKTRYWIAMAMILAALPVGARQSSGAEAMPTSLQAPSPAPADSASPQASAPVQAATQDPGYIIGAQDVLDISVWKDPDLTRTVPVRPDGKITLPLLNDVQAAGLTPDQLKTSITQGLVKYMQMDPVVTVIVTQINSQRFYVSGEVNRAGEFALLPHTTVLQALSSAGGFTQFANTKKIYLIRIVNGKQESHPFNYKDVVHGKNTDQNIELKAGDQIVVP